MRLVIQRVDYASVTVGGERISEIGAGYLVLLGIRVGDTEREAAVFRFKSSARADLVP